MSAAGPPEARAGHEIQPAVPRTGRRLSPELANDFCRIALGHVALEYPYGAFEVLLGPEDFTRTAKDLHPIFYGSYDWHSCVHGYWLLARLNRLFPALPNRDAIIAQLNDAFTPEKVAGELAFFSRAYAESFERPYGWVWFLKLVAELRLDENPAGRQWAATLQPLADDLAVRLAAYFRRLRAPVRGGYHANSAFNMALAVDYALAMRDTVLLGLMRERARAWFSADIAATRLDFGGTDFLSPTFTVAEAMRRLLPAAEFQRWWRRYLPDIARGKPEVLLLPAVVADPTDGKLAHLDGLNLSRAWAMRNLAGAVEDEGAATVLRRAAESNLAASMQRVEGHYMSTHWIATFALLALEAGEAQP